MNLIEDITLNGEPNTQYMRFGPHKNFSVKACYYAMNYGGVTVLGNTDIWNSLAPKKRNFFAWLALHNRINTRQRLSRKGIISESTSPFGCQCDENLTHLLFFLSSLYYDLAKISHSCLKWTGFSFCAGHYHRPKGSSTNLP
jgi:hypothetical protein